MTTNNQHTAGPLERLKHHVTGAIERGEKTAIVGQPMPAATKVIFRFWNKSVIAIFPQVAATVGNPYHCQSYEHIGQHGACDPQGVIGRSRPATPEEYKGLASELKRIGYNLRIANRIHHGDLAIRKRELEMV